MFRLIKHTESFVEDEEGLCIQVLQHLRNMVERETRFGRKVYIRLRLMREIRMCELVQQQAVLHFSGR